LLIIAVENLDGEVEFNIDFANVSGKPILLKRESYCHFSNVNDEKILAVTVRFLTRKELRDVRDTKINLTKVRSVCIFRYDR
jgi:hypothetical protein